MAGKAIAAPRPAAAPPLSLPSPPPWPALLGLSALRGRLGWAWLLLATVWLGPVLVQGLLGDWVPTTDGPFHMAQAWWWAQVGWQGTLPSPVAEHWEWNPRLDPNLGAYPALVALLWLGVPPPVALALWLLVYGLGWLLACAWAGGMGQRGWLAALLCAPVGFGFFIHAGYLNYSLGLVGVMAFIGLRRWQGHAIRPQALLVASLATLLLALTHIVALGGALLYLAAEVLALASVQRRMMVVLTCGSRLLAATLPAVVLALSFVWATAGQTPPDLEPMVPLGTAQVLVSVLDPLLQHISGGLRALLTGGLLLSFSRLDVLVAALCGAALLAATVAGLKAPPQRHQADPGADFHLRCWLIWGGLALVLTVVEVRSAQGVSLSERLVPFVWMAAVFWVAARWPTALPGQPARGPLAWPRLHGLVLVLASAGLLLQSALRLQAYRAWAEPLNAAWQAGSAHPGLRWVGAALGPQDGALWQPQGWRVHPALHAPHLAALAGGGVALSSSLGSTRYFGYFPLRHRAVTDWLDWYPAWEEQPGLAPPIASYRARAAGAPDALLATGPPADVHALGVQLGLPLCVAQAEMWRCSSLAQSDGPRGPP